MRESFQHSAARDSIRHKAALLLHVDLDRWQGIAWASNHSSDTSVEHGDIVMVVTRSEAFVCREIEQPRKLAESTAFAVT